MAEEPEHPNIDPEGPEMQPTPEGFDAAGA